MLDPAQFRRTASRDPLGRAVVIVPNRLVVAAEVVALLGLASLVIARELPPAIVAYFGIGCGLGVVTCIPIGIANVDGDRRRASTWRRSRHRDRHRRRDRRRHVRRARDLRHRAATRESSLGTCRVARDHGLRARDLRDRAPSFPAGPGRRSPRDRDPPGRSAPRSVAASPSGSLQRSSIRPRSSRGC